MTQIPESDQPNGLGPPTDKAAIYARVSSTDQNLEIQQAALKAAGCDVIRSEKRSGTSTTGRAELQTVLDFLRPGDVLMVTRIDRLARSIGDLQDCHQDMKQAMKESAHHWLPRKYCSEYSRPASILPSTTAA